MEPTHPFSDSIHTCTLHTRLMRTKIVVLGGLDPRYGWGNDRPRIMFNDQRSRFFKTNDQTSSKKLP